MTNLLPRSTNPHELTPPISKYQSANDLNNPLADESLDLRKFFGLLRRNSQLVIAVAVLVGTVAAFVLVRQPPEYRASAMIRLKNERQSLTGSLEGNALDQMIGRTADPMLSQIEQLRSRSLARAVVNRLGLRLQPLDHSFVKSQLLEVSMPDDAPVDTLTLRFHAERYEIRTTNGGVAAKYGQPVEHRGVKFTIRRYPGVKEAAIAVLPEEQAISRVQRNLHAKAREQTDVVEVTFTSNDPARSQAIVNTAIEVFQQMNAEAAQDRSRRRRLFLEEQLIKTDSALAAMQAELSAFREREQVFSSRERFTAEQAGMMELELKREDLLSDRRVYTMLLDALSRSSNNRGGSLRALVSAPGLAMNPAISQLYHQLVRYELSRDSLTTGQWSNAQSNPDVQRLNTLIAKTEGSLIEAARSHVAWVDARIASLNVMLARSTAQIRALPEKEAEEMRLVQQVETARQVADQLRAEFQKARIAEAVEVGQVEIIDRAALPVEPVGSGGALKVIIALMLGLMGGISVAFLREHLNTTIQRRDEIEPLLLVPGIGVIPRIEPTGNGNGRVPKLRLPIRSNGNSVEWPLDRLVTIEAGRSSGAEAYRSLRTNLLFSQSANSLKRLVVTSTMAAEGKTTTAANLAVTFAQQDKRVLLIDGDLRKARLHRTFGLTREPGLVDVLVDIATLDQAIRATPVANLSVITSGTLPPNPSELLGGSRLRELLDELSNDYDVIIIDSPPVLVAGDASILGALADGTVIVVRAGQTHRAAAQAAVQQLQAVGARVVGAILNDPDGKVVNYEGYYYYAYKYYGEEEEQHA